MSTHGLRRVGCNRWLVKELLQVHTSNVDFSYLFLYYSVSNGSSVPLAKHLVETTSECLLLFATSFK